MALQHCWPAQVRLLKGFRMATQLEIIAMADHVSAVSQGSVEWKNCWADRPQVKRSTVLELVGQYLQDDETASIHFTLYSIKGFSFLLCSQQRTIWLSDQKCILGM